MMKPIDIHATEQSMQFLADTIPQFLYTFYKKCIEAGFSDDQAMFIMIKQFELMNLQASLLKPPSGGTSEQS